MLSLRHRWQSLKAVRIATHVLPPLGLGMLWRSSQLPLRTKLLGTLYIAAYSALFTYTLLWLLIVGLHLDLLEWREGYRPVLTLSKTLPDYDRLGSTGAG